jgi:ABC-type transport system involved in multi-copper enzyme maturation permease subunit
MRPYLAIIKDSFREALASRVLWIMTGLIAVMLLALAPIGYKTNLTGEINWGEIADAPQLVRRIRRDADASEASPGKRIWSLLDEETRKKLKEIDDSQSDEALDADPKRGRRERRADAQEFTRGMETLRKGLNKLIARRDLYQEEDWKGVTLPKEATDYLERPRSSLSSEELARLNRLLIETPYQSSFVWRSADSVRVTYLWFSTPALPFSKRQVDSVVKQWVLTTAMRWIVGVFGIIAAILVTSTIIPQMFEPGSITLLLSKPISRSLLLIAKFFGACAFVFLNVTLLLVGLWLIAGLRLEMWNSGMLWCIPIFLFMFMIYYTISALTGLIWKSAIISVVLTVVFYFVCFGVDVMHELSQGLIIEQNCINKIVDADGDLLTVTESGKLQLWDDEARTWRLISEPRGGPGIPTIDGPYYHEPSKQLIIGQGFRNPFGLRGQRVSLKLASAADGWKLRDGPPTRAGTAAILLANDNSIIAVTSDNIYRFQGDLGVKGSTISLFGLKIPLPGGGEFRACLSGERSNFPDPVAAAVDPTQPRLAVSAANDVYLYALEADGGVKPIARRTLDAKEKEGAAIAVAGDLVLVAREGGKVLLLSASDLSVKHELTLEPQSQPRFVSTSSDGGRFAVLFQNHFLWFVDSATGAARRAPIPAQGEISGVTWTPDRLLVADYANRVVAYDPVKLTRQQTYRPALTRWELAYYYVISPLHTVFPKPRQLNNTVQYVLTGKRTTDLGFFQGDLAQQREDLDPWQPIKSGLGFVAVLLLLGCLYIERQEF